MIERNRFFTEPPQRTRTVNVDDGWAEPRTPRDTPVTSEAVGEGAIADPSRHQEDSVAQKALVPKDYSNLLEDGSFERQQTRDALTGGWVGDDTVAAEGAWSVKVVTDGNTHETNLLTGVPVYPGERVYLVGRVRSAGGAGAPELFWMEAVWRDADGNVLSTSGWSQPVDNLLTWTAHEEVALAPPGVATFDVRLRLEAVPAGRTVWFDAAEVRRMLAFKSAVDGSRLELDGEGLRLYDSAGNKTVDLEADTGNATFKGDITGGSIRFTGENSDTFLDIRENEGIRFLEENGVTAARLGGLVTKPIPTVGHNSVHVIAYEPFNGDDRYAEISAGVGVDSDDPGADTTLNSSEIELYAEALDLPNAPWAAISLRSGMGGFDPGGSAWVYVNLGGAHQLFQVDSNEIELNGQVLRLNIEPADNAKYARGLIARTQTTSPVNYTTGSTILSLDVPLKAGRAYVAHVGCLRHVATSNDQLGQITFRLDGVIFWGARHRAQSTNPEGFTFTSNVFTVPSDGTYTVTWHCGAIGSSATFTIDANNSAPAYLYIEDVGAAV